MANTRVAALMTCHNRREKTLASLQALLDQDLPPGVSVRVYLVDDGSTDGTADAARAAYPQIELLRGDGNLFWNGGMRLAFAEAMKAGYDYYLWLNDDTLLHPGTLDNLLATHHHLSREGHPASIIVGSTRDAESGTLTYGGVVRKNWWRPLRFELVEPAEKPRECETMNGNCVLVPRAIAKRVGNLDKAFTHGMGDHDYGLRARSLGCSVWVAPGFVGTCSRNTLHGTWRDTNLPLKERAKKVGRLKGLPAGEWKEFTRRHAGPIFYPYYRLSPYLRLLMDSVTKTGRGS